MSNFLTETAEKIANKIHDLEQAMHDAEPSRTLEEQVADMKRRGIDPKESYQKWDDDEKDN